MDGNGRVSRDNGGEASDAPTFSNLDPTTSDAQAMGGNSARTIWGTNFSVDDTAAAFKDFLRNYQKKYRMWFIDGMTQAETDTDEDSTTREYIEMMKNMLALGVTTLSLDFRNLKSYPPTKKLWQQVQDYPQDIITIMDQTCKDVMYEVAEAEMAKQARGSARNDSQRSRVLSSEPPIPSSDRIEPEATPREQAAAGEDLCAMVHSNYYRIRPFGLDKTVNMRELNPSGMLFQTHIKQGY